VVKEKAEKEINNTPKFELPSELVAALLYIYTIIMEIRISQTDQSLSENSRRVYEVPKTAIKKGLIIQIKTDDNHQIKVVL